MREVRGKTTTPMLPPADRAERLLTVINERLDARYGKPRLGNPKNPLDDLIFILLSARTRGVVHEATYRELKRRFRSWSDALASGPRGIRAAIEGAGLGWKKAQQIHCILSRLADVFGRPTLAPLRGLSDEDAEAFLTSLPGVGLKTARCVLMYCFGRSVFPVDAHVLRIFGYFGLINPELRQEFAQDPVQGIVPNHLRYSLHVNLVAHGRTTCLPARPRCDECPLEDLCPTSRLRAKALRAAEEQPQYGNLRSW